MRSGGRRPPGSRWRELTCVVDQLSGAGHSVEWLLAELEAARKALDRYGLHEGD